MSKVKHIKQHKNDETGIAQESGELFERKFVELCHKKGYVVKNATRKEERMCHIDFWVTLDNGTKISVEVKGMKRMRRYKWIKGKKTLQPFQNKLHHVEWQNKGRPGWVCGIADFIAFGMCEPSRQLEAYTDKYIETNGCNFMMIDRATLQEHANSAIEKKGWSVISNWKEKKKCKDGVLYRRPGENDLVTMFDTKTLLNLNFEKNCIWTNN